MGKSTLNGPAKSQLNKLVEALDQEEPNAEEVTHLYASLCRKLRSAPSGEVKTEIVTTLKRAGLLETLVDMTAFKL